MNKDIKYIIKLLINIIFLLLLICYVVYHIFIGQYNIFSFIERKNFSLYKESKLKKINMEIQEIENKKNILQDNNLNSDILDEKIREATGYAKKNEIIIYSKDLENDK